MTKLFTLSVSDENGENYHEYTGTESARSIMSFVQVADERNDLVSVTIELSDGTMAVFLPVGGK